ncbi:MAG: hypothetical protein JWO03_1578 [Bacteroidetes bacterium]|nr:hypothetical protein [Bacteroidota bacterium]
MREYRKSGNTKLKMKTIKMKTHLLALISLMMSMTAYSQVITFKAKVVSIDGTECLKIKDSDPNNVSFTDMEGHEVIFLKYIHNSRYGSLYNRVIFMDLKKSLTTKSYIFTQKLLIKKLINDGVIKDCKLVPGAVESFIMKYDENIEQ